MTGENPNEFFFLKDNGVEERASYSDAVNEDDDAYQMTE